MKASIWTILISLMTLGFQNCGGVNFNSQDGLALTAKNENPDLNSEINSDKDIDGDLALNVDKDEDQLNPVYICILDGPGHSQSLGIIEEDLAWNGPTPNTLCMSKRACLEIASKKFPVKFAMKKGACKGNPHVIHISDKDLSDKIDLID